jgi:hypothetical protein
VAEWWKATDAELLAALAPMQARLNALYAEMLELVAEVDTRNIAGKEGFVTTIDLLRCTQNLTRPEARRRIEAAQEVLPRRAVSGDPTEPVLPHTATAVAQAAVSGEHIAVIRAVLAALPPRLEEHREQLEADLAGWARTFDPRALGLLGRRRLSVLDPDGPEPRDADPTRSRLSLVEQGTGFAVGGWLGREDTAVLRTALGPLAAPVPAADGTPDPRTGAERDADALVGLARRMLDTATLPAHAGVRPHVTVTVPLTVLESRLGSGLLDLADATLPAAITAEDARRWACDAHLTPVVLGANSEPLDVGRASYTVPRALRRALAQRDGGCAFPGCTVPAQWADAHHIEHWAQGGATALHNLVLLCPRHHTVLHSTEWEVTITEGFPLFHPPPWIPGGPRTNPLHRVDLFRHDKAG